MASEKSQDFRLENDVNTSGVPVNAVIITSGHVLELAEKAAFEVYLYPFIVILVFMTVGFIGNSIVLYIFSCRWKTSKTTVFILTLAILDIFNCCWNMSVEAAILYHPLTFDLNTLCKVSRYSSYVVTASYSFVLVAIGFDRYLMICKPFKSMTLGVTYARRCCICGVIFGIATQWPSLLFYGTFVFRIPIKNGGDNVTSVYVEGRTCLVNNYYLENKLLPFAFQGFLFVGHIVIFVLLITVYIVIGRKLFLASRLDICAPQRKPSKMFRMSVVSAVTGFIPKSSLCSRGSRTTSIDNIQTASSAPLPAGNRNGDRRASLEQQTRECNRCCKKHGSKVKCTCTNLSEAKSVDNILDSDSFGSSKRRSVNPVRTSLVTGNPDRYSGSSYGSAATGSDRNSNPISSTDFGQPLIGRSQSVDPNYKFSVLTNRNRISTDLKEASLRQNTLIMRMVTFTFILSYFPFLVIVSLRYSNPDVPQSIDTVSKILYHVFLRSYFFNSVIRPFIYMFMDADYRKNVVRIVSCGRFGAK